VTAKTWSVKRPVSAYCLWTFWPASVIRSPSRVQGTSFTVAGMVWVAKGPNWSEPWV
jgi:hypothetical protein